MAQLPDYPQMVSPDFHWSLFDSATSNQAFGSTYQELAHWRKNCFNVLGIPMGKFCQNLLDYSVLLDKALPLRLLLYRLCLFLESCYFRSLKITLATYSIVDSCGMKVILGKIMQYRITFLTIEIQNWPGHLLA